MGYSRFDPAIQARAAWNAGKTVGTKRPLTQKQIWAIRFHLDREGRLRDKALFDLAIDSKLRGCDLVKIKKQIKIMIKYRIPLHMEIQMINKIKTMIN